MPVARSGVHTLTRIIGPERANRSVASLAHRGYARPHAAPTAARRPAEEPAIRQRLIRTPLFALLAALAFVLPSTLGASGAAEATSCAAPRTTFSAFGIATRIQPGLCELPLRAGANLLRWEREATSPEQAFAALDFGALHPAFSVWHYDPERRRWSGWGPAAPSAVPQIGTLEAGQLYFIDAPSAATWELPANASIFADTQVISFYGFPGIPFMGALGSYSPAGAIAAVDLLAREYDALNGDLSATPAVHPIVAVAQPTPQLDGSYLSRMDPSTIAAYVEAARAADALVFLDIQIGYADPLAEVQRLEPFLREPFVHLALDPEFATAIYGAAPGSVIGSLTSTDVNRVQAYLAELVRDEGIPPKALVLHQFNGPMLLDPEGYNDVPEVEIVVDMDGFGGPAIKTRHYGFYALAPYSEVPAIKLFFDWDIPLMSPATIQALSTPPSLVIYQ